MKGKEEVSETMLNEKETSQLSDIKFKALVIRKIKSSHRITKNDRKTTMNSPHCKLYQQQKGNRNYQQGPGGNEECNF